MRSLSQIRRATSAIALTLIACGSTGSSPPALVNEASVDAAVAPYVGTQIPGLSVAVGYHGRVIFSKAYGKADLAHGTLMTTETHLEIGSLTKEMTSGALLTLSRDKLLSIDDKVNLLLPQYLYGNRMTLRDMSTMSSGLQGQDEGGDALFGIVEANTHSTVAEIYKKLNANAPTRAAGTKFDYANIGYWLLGRTIEAATKTSYADAMQSRVFTPLGMTTAYIRVPGSRDANLATGYTRFGDGSFHTCPELDIRSSDSSGMGVMTASDVIAWDEGVRAQRLVQGSLAKAMFTTNGLQVPGGEPGDSYAMGWFFGAAHGIYTHPGDTILFASFNMIFPDGIDVVILANSQYNKYSTDRYTIGAELHNAVYGVAPIEVPKVTATLSNLTSCPNS
jgi:D-alanyl-D-alanine carboxypeptidase